jgi:hypothetical protein
MLASAAAQAAQANAQHLFASPLADPVASLMLRLACPIVAAALAVCVAATYFMLSA